MFRVEPNFEIGVIEATVSGSVVRVPECQQLFDQVDESVQLTGIHCVLLEVEANHASGEPLSDKLRLANRMASDPTLTHTKFAYVAAEGTEIDPVIEMLAKAKGFQGQRFESRQAALDWLTAAQSPCAPAASRDSDTRRSS
jgi:hypothetical protein